MGICHEFGIGVEKDASKAFHYYSMAAEEGDSVASNNLGWMYIHGKGISQNPQKAFQTFSNIKGSEYGYNSLGFCYKYGIGTQKDLVKAAGCFRKASKSKYRFPCAIVNLGQCYQDGLGVNVNPTRAQELFGVAEELFSKEDAARQHNYGKWFEEGYAVDKNLYRALHLYTMAADRGHPQAYCASIRIRTEILTLIAVEVTSKVLFYLRAHPDHKQLQSILQETLEELLASPKHAEVCLALTTHVLKARQRRLVRCSRYIAYVLVKHRCLEDDWQNPSFVRHTLDDLFLTVDFHKELPQFVFDSEKTAKQDN
eukprot:TRINITY_DN16496_c0_g1_i1.p1 TRINITY_DN16496_c0_g1~~TRINITY_DN16496_c0_g1_i1.p1  ORF type:complete len:350 (-),score=38.34 TRINITY_DN16496_c0_g1_i1:54-989(-)